MNDIATVFRFKADLDAGVKRTRLSTLFAQEDSGAHRFDIAVERGGEPVDLTGARVFAWFLGERSAASLRLNGSASGNVASVVLTEACYAQIGAFALTVKIAAGDAVSTVFMGGGSIARTRTDAILDPEDIIPSIDELIAQLEEMRDVTASTNAAADGARQAAETAASAAQEANRAAGAADASAGRADQSALAANAAAAWVGGLTVSADALDTGQAAAEATERDGHLHIAFGLPRGDTGATPQITFTAATGAPGTQVQVEQSGTAEAPTVHLTIPRGDTGDIGSLSINGKTPGPDGAVTLGIGDIEDLQSAIDNAGGVKTVAGVSPDEAGNVPLTAQDVGARPDTWTPSAEDVGARPNTWTPSASEIPGLSEAIAAGAGGVSVELLYTNGAPGSSFSAQDLAIDLSGYDMFAVWTVHSTTTETITPIAIGPVGKSVAAQLIYGSNGRVGSRKFTDNGTTITVGPGQYNGGSDNKYLIPYQIYGIKGVKSL